MGLFTIDIYQLHVPFWTTSLSCESLQENCHFLATIVWYCYSTHDNNSCNKNRHFKQRTRLLKREVLLGQNFVVGKWKVGHSFCY